MSPTNRLNMSPTNRLNMSPTGRINTMSPSNKLSYFSQKNRPNPFFNRSTTSVNIQGASLYSP